MLAMKIDRSGAKLLEHGGRGQGLIDERPAPALCRNLPTDNDLVAVRRLEDGLHGGLVLAGAHEIRRCAGTE